MMIYIKKIFVFIYAILIAGMVFPANVNSYNNFTPVKSQSLPKIKTGDLVTRKGKGLISHVFAKLSDTQQRFSHIGVIWIIDNKPFVLHVMGHTNKNTSHLRLDPLAHFIDKQRASVYGLFSLNIESQELENLPHVFKKTLEKRIQFDDDFDLNTQDAMYCTEFIRYCFNSATNNKDFFQTEFRKDQSYITIGNIISKATEL